MILFIIFLIIKIVIALYVEEGGIEKETPEKMSKKQQALLYGFREIKDVRILEDSKRNYLNE